MTSRVSSDEPESEVKTPELFSGEEGQVGLEKVWVKDAEEALTIKGLIRRTLRRQLLSMYWRRCR
jgi:hypothetical protein